MVLANDPKTGNDLSRDETPARASENVKETGPDETALTRAEACRRLKDLAEARGVKFQELVHEAIVWYETGEVPK